MSDDNASERRRLAKVLEQYDDDPHWENFMARGLSHHEDGEWEMAVKCYERAKASIEGDPNVSWQDIIEDIKMQIDRVKHQEPPTQGIQRDTVVGT